MSLTAAVLVVTSGRNELSDCLNSIEAQDYPVTTYVVTDAIIDFYEFIELKNKYKADNRHFCYWPTKIGGEGWEGRRLIAGCTSLINEDVLFVTQDDDWFKPNHVSSLMEIIESGHDWAYSLMSVYDKDGLFLFDDICECLGEEHVSYNTDTNFAPTGSIAMKTRIYCGLAVYAYNLKGYGPDRIFYDLAKNNYHNFKGSKLHTNCFRLGGNDGSVKKEFFDLGISMMKSKYGNKMPWQ